MSTPTPTLAEALDALDAEVKALHEKPAEPSNGNEPAKKDGEGWVDYKWPNPTTKKVEGKSSYVKKVGDLIIGVGIYKG